MDKGPRSQPLSVDRLKKEESLRQHYGKGQKKKRRKHIQEQQRLRGPRGEEPIMFPFWMIDPSGQGRRRRRDTSSSVSRKRARRRDRRRRRSSSESDRRGRKRERSRDAQQASASSSSLPLGGAPQGYAWVQVPVNAQGLPTMPSMPIAAEATQPPAKEETWDRSWKKQTPWKGGESWKKGTTKSWNKWVNPDWKHKDKPYQQKGYGHRGQSWSQGSSQQQPPPPPPPPPQSEQEPSDQQEEESWHESLWRDAVRTAVHDENRPLSARELVREGKMRDWWSMSWGQCKELVDGEIHDHYRTRLAEMFAAQADSKAPDAVVDRFSAVCAYFQQCGISLEHEEALEMTVFKVPGQKVACIRTKFEGPSYSHPRNARFTMVASHGMPCPCAMGLAEHGELCPGDHVDGEYPQYGFSARGTCDDFNTESLKQSIGKVVSKAKGMGQIVATYEGTLERATPQTEGGMPYLSAACKDAGSSRAGDHLTLSPRFAILRAISTSWPA